MRKIFKFISVLSFSLIIFVPAAIFSIPAGNKDVHDYIMRTAYTFTWVVFFFSVGIVSFIYSYFVLKDDKK